METQTLQPRLFSNRALVRLIIPLIIEQGLAVLVGMCDSMMVSSVGEAAISGVSLVDMINNVLLTLFGGLATGGAVVISQFIGARQMDKARDSAGQLVILSGLCGLAAMAFCLVMAEVMMNLFFGSIEADVMEAGLLYLRITALSFPFVALRGAGGAIFRSNGNSRMSMQISLLVNAINVGGNALCIYVLHMGVAGVAVPTLVSRIVGAIVILRLASNRSQSLYLSRETMSRVDRRTVGRILNIGIPSAVENSLFQLGRLVVVSMIALFGTYQTSANAVANHIDGLGYLVGQAFSTAMITVIGQCVGTGDAGQVKYYAKKLLKWCYVLQGLSNILIFIFVHPLVTLYSSLSPETYGLAVLLIQINTACAILLWPVAFVLPNALRAANDVRFTMFTGVGSMAFWRVGFSWILCVQMGYGALGVWIAMIVDWVCRTVFFVTRMLRGKWKTKCAMM